eukprot:1797298-Pyramimonas_sp.AAC.1
MLRHALNDAEEQLEREGVVANLDSRLARAILVGNGLAHVVGVAPCNVVFGGQPAMLPPLEAGESGEASGDCRWRRSPCWRGSALRPIAVASQRDRAATHD